MPCGLNHGLQIQAASIDMNRWIQFGDRGRLRNGTFDGGIQNVQGIVEPTFLQIERDEIIGSFERARRDVLFGQCRP